MTGKSKSKFALTRLPEIMGIGRELDVLLDGKKIGGIPFFDRKEFVVDPGKHTILVKIDWWRSKLKRGDKTCARLLQKLTAKNVLISSNWV